MPRIPVLLSGLLLSASALAAEYHVSPSGSDASPGSAAQPWRTIQKAADTVGAGDVVNVHSGVYAERVSLTGKRGTAALPILFRTPADEARAAVDQDGVTPPDGNSALLAITDCDHVVIQNLEFRNYATDNDDKTPIGIWISEGGSGVKLLDCLVHHVWQSEPTISNYNANAFGVFVKGDASRPIDGFVMNECEVRDLRTGASESVSLNGNVTGFTVISNRVHDCNNIGIDFIGFEGTAPTEALDQARDGICRGNEVWNIDSQYNPAYGGDFAGTSSNETRSAPGIYVDGGRNIRIERNHVHGCNFGVSLSSEQHGKVASGVILRDNLVHHCHVGGLVLGGADNALNGGLSTSTITHNTFYRNDTVGFGGGQVMFQHHVSGTTLQHNIVVCHSPLNQFVLKTNTTGSAIAGAINWNLYSGALPDQLEFIWNNIYRPTFSEWKSATGFDANSRFVADPGLVGLPLTASSPAEDFALLSTSEAVNAGNPAFVPATSERDWGGQPRKVGPFVDIGADEYLTPWQAWRDVHFSLPEGGPGADYNVDPDGDGLTNLLEFSQGTDPLSAGHPRLPRLAQIGNFVRYSYRKEGSGVGYEVQQAPMPGPWIPAVPPEQTDGNGLFWRDFTAPERLYIQLKVSF